MQVFKNWKPTQFDSAGNGPDDIQSWYVVPVLQTRESGTLAKSNFQAALDLLGGESETVEVHCFDHWAEGWLEIILLHPSRIAKGEAIENILEEHPVLNEDKYSALLWETAAEYWANISIRERVSWCQRYHVSVFAARRDSVPSDDSGELLYALGE